MPFDRVRRQSGGQARRWAGAAALACLTLYASVAITATGSASDTGYEQAVAALGDTQAAIRQIKDSAQGDKHGADEYKAAARRALNALVGEHDSRFDSSVGNPGDSDGTIGHLNTLLHRPQSQPWNASVHGAWVNTMVAVAALRRALRDDELSDFQTDMTDALQSLEIVQGRPSDIDSLGGLQGAMAATTLGVPSDARQVSGCKPVPGAPAYGVTNGYLLYVALPVNNGIARMTAQAAPGENVDVHKDYLVIHTPASVKTGQLCGQQGNPSRPNGTDNSADTAGKNANEANRKDPANSGGPGKLFTQEQAIQGKVIYVRACSSCHGADMQGASAPANAGTAFLKKTQALGWSVSDLRYLVVNSMPLDNPSSLSPEQYAQVLAYLLAKNCYSAGSEPFPINDTPGLKKTQLQPLPETTPDHANSGTCNVQ